MAVDDVSSLEVVQINTTNANSSAVINQMETEEVAGEEKIAEKKKVKEKKKVSSN